MTSKHIDTWLLMSAVTVVVAVVLLTVAVPVKVEAGVSTTCTAIDSLTCQPIFLLSDSCSEVRGNCRKNGALGYMKRGDGPWKQICGPMGSACTPPQQ